MKSAFKILTIALLLCTIASAQSPYPGDWPYTPITTPNGRSLEWKIENGVKVFKLVAEEIDHEMAPGTVIKAWGFNGDTPGPTIEVVQGDRVRILVENKLPDSHWFIECMERGGRIVVIAPEYGAPSTKADYWIPIRPATDAALWLGVTRLMMDRGWYDEKFVKEIIDFNYIIK